MPVTQPCCLKCAHTRAMLLPFSCIVLVSPASHLWVCPCGDMSPAGSMQDGSGQALRMGLPARRDTGSHIRLLRQRCSEQAAESVQVGSVSGMNCPSSGSSRRAANAVACTLFTAVFTAAYIHCDHTTKVPLLGRTHPLHRTPTPPCAALTGPSPFLQPQDLARCARPFRDRHRAAHVACDDDDALQARAALPPPRDHEAVELQAAGRAARPLVPGGAVAAGQPQGVEGHAQREHGGWVAAMPAAGCVSKCVSRVLVCHTCCLEDTAPGSSASPALITPCSSATKRRQQCSAPFQPC